MTFKIQYLNEPVLMFGKGGKTKDPRAGLILFGPRTPTNSGEKINIKVGMIGSNRSLSETQRIFNEMRNQILPETDEPEKWKIPFPGMRDNSPLQISLNMQKRWRQTFSSKEIEHILFPENRDVKIERLLEKINEKMSILYDKETPPDVIIINLPDSIYSETKSPAYMKPKLQTEDSDFHSRIKLLGMTHRIPTQLIHPFTLEGKMTQDKSDIAWNLAVGLLYKSQKGHPWKLAELETNTCFAGISFYVERGKERRSTKAAMAQVFLDSGESFILRGDQLKDSIGDYQNHLTESDAKLITKKIIEQYKIHRGGSKPGRLVIHKTSDYWDEEKEGILQAASSIEVLDLITIRVNHDYRLFTTGDYPILRGTLLSSSKYEENFLYTTGYIPTLGTYPGHRVPIPILIKPNQDAFNSPIQVICEEILAFTKLDWNSSHFCKKLPVTIEVSQAVGNILAETKAQRLENIDPHYYFYM